MKKTKAPTRSRRARSARSRRDRTTLTCALSTVGVAWAAGDDYDVDGGLIDRFYVKVDDDRPELSVGGLSLTAPRP